MTKNALELFREIADRAEDHGNYHNVIFHAKAADLVRWNYEAEAHTITDKTVELQMIGRAIQRAIQAEAFRRMALTA